MKSGTGSRTGGPPLRYVEDLPLTDGTWSCHIDKKTEIAALSLHPADSNLGRDKWRIDLDLDIAILRGEDPGQQGRRVSVGLREKEPYLKITTQGLSYEPHTLAGGAGRTDEFVIREAHDVRILGPLHPDCKRVKGAPLAGETHLVTVAREGYKQPSIIVELRAGQRAFKVLDDVRPDEEISDTPEQNHKEIIVNALMREVMRLEGSEFVLGKARAIYKPIE
jgi:hypothetical protein